MEVIIAIILIIAIVALIRSRSSKANKEQSAQDLSREEKKQQRIADFTPVRAQVIASKENYKSRTKKSAVGTAARGIVGGALLGPIGAVAGMATSKGKTKTVATSQDVTFAVEYASGRKGTETVRVGTARFNLLSSLTLQ